jgi:hypothetical protein
MILYLPMPGLNTSLDIGNQCRKGLSGLGDAG